MSLQPHSLSRPGLETVMPAKILSIQMDGEHSPSDFCCCCCGGSIRIRYYRIGSFLALFHLRQNNNRQKANQSIHIAPKPSSSIRRWSTTLESMLLIHFIVTSQPAIGLVVVAAVRRTRRRRRGTRKKKNFGLEC